MSGCNNFPANDRVGIKNGSSGHAGPISSEYLPAPGDRVEHAKKLDRDIVDLKC
jgi:hypothetical protein